MKGFAREYLVPFCIGLVLSIAISRTGTTLVHYILVGMVCYTTGLYFTKELWVR